MSVDPTPTRRGRLPAAEQARRRDAVLDAVEAELVAAGPAGLTTAGVARRAGASKETLYRWFGDRRGLLVAVIERNADRSAERISAALDGGGGEPGDVLVEYAVGLLRLLVGDGSVALNRAAMVDPELASVLLASGRFRVGPIVEGFLADVVGLEDPAEGFRTLYGLVVQDTQIRVLLGDPPPTDDALRDQAARAVARFLHLVDRGVVRSGRRRPVS